MAWKIFLNLVFIIFCWEMSFAQIKKIKEQSLATGKQITIEIAGDYVEDFRTRTKPVYTTLYRRDTKSIFLGNRCADQVMQSYGLEYVVVTQSVNISASKYFFHNFWANTKLFFNNGPFWKNRMRKKIDECIEKTGDFVDR